MYCQLTQRNYVISIILAQKTGVQRPGRDSIGRYFRLLVHSGDKIRGMIMKLSAIRCARISAVAGVILTSTSPIGGFITSAHAQSVVCNQVSTYLEERKALVSKINKLGKQPDAKKACSLFGSLISNGNTTIKWLETNQDWCQIPNDFIAGFKADNAKASEIRGQACKAATQQAAMEKKARELQQENQSQMLGGSAGDPVTGQMKIPQGAL